MELSEDQKIQLIKQAISSVEGWKNLALSLNGDPSNKEKCIELLRKIGGDKMVALPVIIESTGEPDEVSITFSDVLIMELEKNIDLLNKRKE